MQFLKGLLGWLFASYLLLWYENLVRNSADMEMSEIVMYQETGTVKYLVLYTKVAMKPPDREVTKGNYGHMNTETVR